MHYRTITLAEVEPEFIVHINGLVLVVDSVEPKPNGYIELIMHQAFFVMTTLTYSMPGNTGIWVMYSGRDTEH